MKRRVLATQAILNKTRQAANVTYTQDAESLLIIFSHAVNTVLEELSDTTLETVAELFPPVNDLTFDRPRDTLIYDVPRKRWKHRDEA